MNTASPRGREPAAIGVGLHVLGIGSGSKPEIVATVASEADRLGFATLWCGEHVVMVDDSASRYPYSADGKIAVPADADWLDPLLALTFAAAHSRRIALATGILLLPEHNPLLVAKQAATIDVLSGGRFALGVGIGWSAEEFAALGVPFARRGARTSEYIAAIRAAWEQDVASFRGEFTNFDRVRVNPRPVRGGHIPVIMGGTTDTALRRTASVADGWYGFNVPADEIAGRIALLTDECEKAGRNARELRIAVSVPDAEPDLLPDLAAAGVTELSLVASPPAEPAAALQWVHDLAARWLTG